MKQKTKNDSLNSIEWVIYRNVEYEKKSHNTWKFNQIK